jgi:hypothetical protein
VIFDKEANTLIISPLTEFMAASSWHEGDSGGNIYWGIMGGVDEVPYHYTYKTMVYYAKGINKVKCHERFSIYVVIRKFFLGRIFIHSIHYRY